MPYKDKEKNRDKMNESRKKWRDNNKEKIREWEQSQNGKFCRYKTRSKERNISFQLTKKQFISFWQKNCHYCGSKIETIGIDRVDNNKGYLIDNIVACCRTCNSIKNNRTLDEFENRL